MQKKNNFFQNAKDELIPSYLMQYVAKYFERGEKPNLTHSSEHKLQLVGDTELGQSAHTLVWRGIVIAKEKQ